MFDVGFSEVVLLMVIGLIVLGPERLPRVARTLGAYVRKARNAWHQVKYDIDRELQASEMREQWRESVGEVRKDLDAARQDMEASAKSVDDQVKQLDQAARTETEQMRQELQDTEKQIAAAAQERSDGQT